MNVNDFWKRGKILTMVKEEKYFWMVKEDVNNGRM